MVAGHSAAFCCHAPRDVSTEAGEAALGVSHHRAAPRSGAGCFSVCDVGVSNVTNVTNLKVFLGRTGMDFARERTGGRRLPIILWRN